MGGAKSTEKLHSLAFQSSVSAVRSLTRVTLLLLFSLTCAAAAPQLETVGLVREFPAGLAEVRQAVLAIAQDRVIHGTLIFDKEPVLTGAEAVDSTELFEPWRDQGEVFYKIRRNSIAPRHFAASADQGTIAVRYIVVPVGTDRTRVRVDAIYVESSHRKTHTSDGTVEKSELIEIKEQLEASQLAAQQAADTRRRQQSAELVRQTYVRQRQDETARLDRANSDEQKLEEEVNTLHRELERRVKPPGRDLKAAPFHAAASLKSLAAYTDVVILIITPHWLGVETPEGQRGWLPVEDVEPLP